MSSTPRPAVRSQRTTTRIASPRIPLCAAGSRGRPSEASSPPSSSTPRAPMRCCGPAFLLSAQRETVRRRRTRLPLVVVAESEMRMIEARPLVAQQTVPARSVSSSSKSTVNQALARDEALSLRATIWPGDERRVGRAVAQRQECLCGTSPAPRRGARDDPAGCRRARRPAVLPAQGAGGRTVPYVVEGSNPEPATGFPHEVRHVQLRRRTRRNPRSGSVGRRDDAPTTLGRDRDRRCAVLRSTRAHA